MVLCVGEHRRFFCAQSVCHSRSYQTPLERHVQALQSSRQRLLAGRQQRCRVASGDAAESTVEVTTYYRQTELTLKRPLGMVLSENSEQNTVFVEELVQGGNAEASGKVAVGDIVAKVSATILKAGKEGQYEKEGYGQRPYDNWSQIMFDCEGQDFDTVMKALDSNNPRWGINTVTLVLKRKV